MYIIVTQNGSNKVVTIKFVINKLYFNFFPKIAILKVTTGKNIKVL